MTDESIFLRRPPSASDQAHHEKFAEIFDRHVATASGDWIKLQEDVPKWEFLCYLTDRKLALSHGSGNPDILEFEPRKSNDVTEFGDQQAVYAASDALWAMYFAIVNRGEAVTSLVNSCFHFLEGEDQDPFYFFSVNESAEAKQAWRTGTIYLLPADSFEQQNPFVAQGKRVSGAQWRSFEPVRPLAKLSVEPSDFPFLNQIRFHDPEIVFAKAQENPDDFPWL